MHHIKTTFDSGTDDDQDDTPCTPPRPQTTCNPPYVRDVYDLYDRTLPPRTSRERNRGARRARARASHTEPPCGGEFAGTAPHDGTAVATVEGSTMRLRGSCLDPSLEGRREEEGAVAAAASTRHTHHAPQTLHYITLHYITRDTHHAPQNDCITLH